MTKTTITFSILAIAACNSIPICFRPYAWKPTSIPANVGSVGHLYQGGLPGYPYFGGYPGYGGYPYVTGYGYPYDTGYGDHSYDPGYGAYTYYHHHHHHHH